MTDRYDSGDYNLRVLIERMQRLGSSEREIEMALREASGCLAQPADPRWTARRRPPSRAIGRRLLRSGQLAKREEGWR